MSRDIGQEDNSRISLQLEADRTGPKQRPSLIAYLAVLFAAAFLLLLVSYLMELRSQITQEDALPTMTMEERNGLAEDNVMLNAKNEQIEIQLSQLKERVAQLEKTVGELSAQQEEDLPADAAEQSSP